MLLGLLHAEEVVISGLIADQRDVNLAGVDKETAVGRDLVGLDFARAVRAQHSKKRREQSHSYPYNRRP